MTPIRLPLHAVSLAVVLPLCAHPCLAQEMRDPTVAPGAQATTPGLPTAGSEGMTVLVRDGKPYLVVGTRLYAVGDTVGQMRVDRITESEIWLHDGHALIKAPRFAGIARTAAVDPPACVPKVAPQQKRRARVVPPNDPSAPVAPAPCEDTQP